MEQGRVVAQGSLRELTAGGERQHGLAVEPANPTVQRALEALGRVRADGGKAYTIWLPDGADLRAVYAAVAAAGSVVRSLVPHRRSLEEVFLHAVTGGAGIGVRA
jgi:hypothetical protein